MFTRKQIWKLIVPLMIEQVLTSLMGTVDTMMVSTAGSAAISAVALVDSLNVLILQVFTAMAAGGVIVCAQYIGRREYGEATETGRQLILLVTVLSVTITVLFVFMRRPLLHMIFGEVEQAVFDNALIYLLITALSYPFIAFYNAGAALFRVDGNSKLPMMVSTGCNLFNVAGNAVLIFGFHMGAAGAALATLASRVLSGVILLLCLRRDGHTIVIRGLAKIRPKWDYIKRVAMFGIPTGVENSMFHLGKLAIQSSISTLGTVSIAGHAMAASVELLTSNAQLGIGVGLMTIVGQCIGAGKVDEARYYIRRLTGYAWVVTLLVSALFAAIIRPITVLAGMDPEAAALTIRMLYVISIVKPILWTQAYMPAYGMRAAGDVRFSMIASSTTMWTCRVVATTIMIRVLHWGVMAAWYGMFLDWFMRGLVYILRYRSDGWTRHRVIQ